MAGGRDSVCERVNVIHASSVVYACVRACFISPRQQFVCVCVCVCACAEVCSGDRAREKEKCYRFLAEPCWRKICLGGTVITRPPPPPSLFLPSLSLSLSLLTLSLSIHVASIYLFNVAPVSIVRPKQSV